MKWQNNKIIELLSLYKLSNQVKYIINNRNKNDDILLHIAYINHNKNIVKLLLLHIDIYLKNKNKNISLYIASNYY